MKKYVSTLLLIFAVVILFAQNKTDQTPGQKFTIVDKTPIKIQSLSAINSATLNLKQTFNCSLFEDLVIDGTVVIKKGTPVTATIDAIEPSKTNGRPAKLNILYSINAPDGSKIYCKSENVGYGSNFAKKSGNFFSTASYTTLGLGLAMGIIKGKDENGLSIFIFSAVIGGALGIAGLLTTPFRLIKGGEVKIGTGEIIETLVDRDAIIYMPIRS